MSFVNCYPEMQKCMIKAGDISRPYLGLQMSKNISYSLILSVLIDSSVNVQRQPSSTVSSFLEYVRTVLEVARPGGGVWQKIHARTLLSFTLDAYQIQQLCFARYKWPDCACGRLPDESPFTLNRCTFKSFQQHTLQILGLFSGFN